MSSSVRIVSPENKPLTPNCWYQGVCVCVCVCVCSWEYSLLHWSDMSFSITLVFMTYLCVLQGVSSVSMCVFGHVQTSPVCGQTHWLLGKKLLCCKPQTDRLKLTRWQTDKPEISPNPFQCSSWHQLKVSRAWWAFREMVFKDSRQVDICLFWLLVLRCKHQTVSLVPAAWARWA